LPAEVATPALAAMDRVQQAMAEVEALLRGGEPKKEAATVSNHARKLGGQGQKTKAAAASK
jgi:hypothetical protein